jgi:hypothetical protein
MCETFRTQPGHAFFLGGCFTAFFGSFGILIHRELLSPHSHGLKKSAQDSGRYQIAMQFSALQPHFSGTSGLPIESSFT